MDFEEMRARARSVREQYAAVETARYGRAWSREEIMLGFLGDVGDLAKLVQGKEGVRPREDLDEALAHELADCLWCVMTLGRGLRRGPGCRFRVDDGRPRPLAAR